MSKEAMELAQKWQQTDWNTESPMSADFAVSEANDVISALMDALREALANEALDKKAENARELGLDYEPAQQEPVAYVVYHRMGGSKSLHWPEQHSPDGDANEYQLLPLYTSPPAQRKPLTDEEIIKCWGQVSGTRYGYVAFARAIEAAHGITKGNT